MLTEYSARASQLAGLSLAATQLTAKPLDHTAITLIGIIGAQFTSIIIALCKTRAQERARRERERAELERRQFEREERAREREFLLRAYRSGIQQPNEEFEK